MVSDFCRKIANHHFYQKLSDFVEAGNVEKTSNFNEKTGKPLIKGFPVWQRMKDSNPHKQSQSLVCYHYTNPLSYLKRPLAEAVIHYSRTSDFVKSFFHGWHNILSCTKSGGGWTAAQSLCGDSSDADRKTPFPFRTS